LRFVLFFVLVGLFLVLLAFFAFLSLALFGLGILAGVHAFIDIDVKSIFVLELVE
jgi:hypothetical protein